MESDKLAQVAAFIVATIIGVIGYFKSGRAKPRSYNETTDHIELARLRDQVIEERNRRIADEIRSVRDDFEKIIAAVNVSHKAQFSEVSAEIIELSRRVHDIGERLHTTERNLAVIEDRQRWAREKGE
jgi:septation ring formation regulator EzrA